jgi:hypothetical protein
MIYKAWAANQASKQQRRSANTDPNSHWSSLDEQIFKANEEIIAKQHIVHAIYEARERKRNAQLGNPPTLCELIEIIKTDQPEEQATSPNQTNLDANPPSHIQRQEQEESPDNFPLYASSILPHST